MMLLASGLEDGTIDVWDVPTGTLFQMFRGHTGVVCSVAFSSCQTIIASGGYDKTIRIWNILSGCCDRVLEGHSRVVRDVC